MADGEPAIIRAVTDGADNLVSADEPLMRLQLRCGGELPGIIAIPALLEAVRSARQFKLRLARMIAAQDGRNTIRTWVEIEPHEEPDDGCEITLRNWTATALFSEGGDEIERRRNDIDRGLAEFFVRLDSAQRVLAGHGDAPDLCELALAMESGIGRPWTDFVSIEGAEHHLPMHWRLLDGARLSVPGSSRHWRASLRPQLGMDNELLGFDLLLIAREGLVASLPATVDVPAGLRLIGEDVAPVLLQPIKRIIANAETIRTRLAGPIAEEYAGYAADIAAAGEHLLALLDDLGDLEVVEADDFTTVTEPVDLVEVARKAAGILGVRARERGIVIEVPAEGAVMSATGEFRRVLQILLNLLNNAIRYTPEDTPVTLAVWKENGRACVSVGDQGPGLSAEEALRVFEKFERLGRSGDGGSGLGLYISRRLARAMGGDLSVKSTQGEGACFILELPAGQA
ncbi:MAG TPA: ATP-binding protein [Novosphingobium sp.]